MVQLVKLPMRRLPALRQDLNLAASPSNADGSPAWTLYDPATHRFYQLGWPAFEILARWSLGADEAIAAAVRRDTTLHIDRDDVMAVAQFLVAHQLTEAADAAQTQRLLESRAQQRPSPAKWLMQHYLYFRVPLIRPMPFLRRLSPHVQWLFRPLFWWATLLSAVAGLVLAARQWDEFIHTFHAYSDWRGLAAMAVALSCAKVLHEIGHALTAYRHGCHVPTMGIALLVLWPVLYTDTNEAWKLRARRERLQIGAAGVLAELALAAYATLLWNVLPDGPLRAGAFMLATSTWLLTLALNASPFMRFDGYFLLSDWLRIPNLHERAFALTRWWLRELLFAFGEPPPEDFAAPRRRFLIAFSIAAWLYRLLLFFAIALLVFHFFFRTLGLILMLVEIGWLIVWPVVRELRVWWRKRGELRWNARTIATAASSAVLLFIAFAPLQRTISAAAVIMRAEAQGVFAPSAAMIQSLPLQEGQAVQAGAILAQLYSPELDYQLRAVRVEAATLHWQVEQQPFDEALRKQGAALRKRWESVNEKLLGLERQIERLTLRAPFAGRVADLNPELHAGVWLQAGERLFSLIGESAPRGEAFVQEDVLPRIRAGESADFASEMLEQPLIACRIGGVDPVNLAALDPPYAASIYGGPIASRAGADGALTPLQSTFRVRLDQCRTPANVSRETRGRALLHGEAESYAARGIRWLVAILRREVTL